MTFFFLSLKAFDVLLWADRVGWRWTNEWSGTRFWIYSRCRLSTEPLTLMILSPRCMCAGPEEDDAEVAAESHHQHAQPLPLPVRQSPAGMDGLPLQHALLHRLHGTGIHPLFFFFGPRPNGGWLKLMHLKKKEKKNENTLYKSIKQNLFGN